MYTLELESGVPVKAFLPPEEIEAGAMEQIKNTANHEDAALHVAVMPDVHQGYGVTIGTVFATQGAVVPNAVGVDIGCGMSAFNTQVKYDRERMGREFWQSFERRALSMIPTGFAKHEKPVDMGFIRRRKLIAPLQQFAEETAPLQMGTLGGGNHFLEAQYDENDMIWLMVHSGSRRTGLEIANYYNKLAEREYAIPRAVDRHPTSLASLDLKTHGVDYLHDAQWATDFALLSRERMLDCMGIALEEVIRDAVGDAERINIHHNFAQIEEHQGEWVMVHRKGATSARYGQLGIIPGSMGTPSYIVRGKGNPDSLTSCSHGSGRVMGRKAAYRALTTEEFEKSIEGTFSTARRGYLDEAPMVYKDSEVVISRQTDLVDVVHTLRPIITLKGSSAAKED